MRLLKKNCLPIDRLDFVVPGAQKSGTTALHYFLGKHPGIALPDEQELHFFDDERIFSTQPVNYDLLHEHFAVRGASRTGVRLALINRRLLAGEVTPNYLYWPTAMERIHAYNPQIKLIILLRNPVDRAFAHWNMQRFRNREPLDFLDALKEEENRTRDPLSIQTRRFAYIGRGFYSRQLDRVLNFFPREQLLVIKFEDFRDRKQESLDYVFKFLSVEPLKGIRDKDRNVVPYERQMSCDERGYVYGIFKQEIGKLEQMLGWDLSDWK